MQHLINLVALLVVTGAQEKGLRSTLGAPWAFHRKLFGTHFESNRFHYDAAHFFETFREETARPLLGSSTLYNHTHFVEAIGSILPPDKRISRITQADDYV